MYNQQQLIDEKAPVVESLVVGGNDCHSGGMPDQLDEPSVGDFFIASTAPPNANKGV